MLTTKVFGWHFLRVFGRFGKLQIVLMLGTSSIQIENA